jgi:hypothetical protein
MSSTAGPITRSNRRRKAVLSRATSEVESRPRPKTACIVFAILVGGTIPRISGERTDP